MNSFPGARKPHASPRSLRMRLAALCLPFILGMLSPLRAGADPARLEWDPALGATLRTAGARITLDRNENAPAIVVRFWPNGASQSLVHGEATLVEPLRLQIVYRVEAPYQTPLAIIRELRAREESPTATVLTEQFTLSATQPITKADVEVERPFKIEADAPLTTTSELSLIRPRAGGWAEVASGGGPDPLDGEYRFGSPYPRAPRRISARTLAEEADTTGAIAAVTPALALPLVQAGGPGWRCAVMADPAFGALFSVRLGLGGVSGVVSYYNAARAVALTSQTRTFAFRIQTGAPARRPLDDALEAFTTIMRPDAPPPPAWARRIALIDLADCGASSDTLEAGLNALAGWLSPAERGRVAVIVRGWQNALFPYGFDRELGGFERAWLIPGSGRPRWMTPALLRQRLHAAKALGFRVLLEMSDSLADDTGTPYFPADWAMRDRDGKPIPAEPAGRAAYGPLTLLNPADPRVADWFLAYTDALLAEFGKDLDGFVIGGTWRVPAGAALARPRPTWADGALLSLIRAIHARIKDYNPELILLTGDNPGPGRRAAPYALAADGSLNSSDFAPAAAAAGLFPCAHGVQWESARAAAQRFPSAVWCARELGLPLAIGEDGLDPAQWTRYQRDRVLKAFNDLHRRQERNDPPRYLVEPPEDYLKSSPDQADSGDLVPPPAPGEINWAADAETTVSASSEQPGHPATAATDKTLATGWASDPAYPLPEWLELVFAAPRTLTRFVVHSVHDSLSTTATAGNLGLTRYEIQAWDEKKESWSRVLGVDMEQAVRTRVHELKKPVQIQRLRLLVSDVAPLDGVARVAGFEAWGTR